MICISYCTSSSTIWPVFSLFLIFFRLVSRAFSRLKEKRNMRNMKNIDYVAAYAMRHNDTRGWEHYYHWRFEIPIGWKVSKYGVFSGLYFPAFGLNISPYPVQMRENMDQKKLSMWTRFTQWMPKLNKEGKFCSLLDNDNFVILC